MGVPPTPSRPPPSSGNSQVVLVFIPAPSLRRAYLVPLEVIAGLMLLICLVVRIRRGGSLPGESEEQRSGHESREITQQPSEGRDGPGQRSERGTTGNIQQPCGGQDGLGQMSERGARETIRQSCEDRDAPDAPPSGDLCSDDTAVASPDDPEGHENAIEDIAAPCGVPASEENHSIHERAASLFGGSGPSEEVAQPVHEDTAVWPCPLHPPDHPVRFCDLAEEEQEAIMVADLEAYKSAWRPGDRKYVLWNPDPELPDEEQGQEAFHDENYEFFWWTPTSYRTSREKHVYYPGNETIYPIHGPVYCPACDRHVWEALPKEDEHGQCPAYHSVPASSESQQGSHSRQSAQLITALPESHQAGLPTQGDQCPNQVAQSVHVPSDSREGGLPKQEVHCSVQLAESPVPASPVSHQDACPTQENDRLSLLSSCTGEQHGYQHVFEEQCQVVPGSVVAERFRAAHESQERLIQWNPDLPPDQQELQLRYDEHGRPVWRTTTEQEVHHACQIRYDERYESVWRAPPSIGAQHDLRHVSEGHVQGALGLPFGTETHQAPTITTRGLEEATKETVVDHAFKHINSNHRSDFEAMFDRIEWQPISEGGCELREKPDRWEYRDQEEKGFRSICTTEAVQTDPAGLDEHQGLKHVTEGQGDVAHNTYGELKRQVTHLASMRPEDDAKQIIPAAFKSHVSREESETCREEDLCISNGSRNPVSQKAHEKSDGERRTAVDLLGQKYRQTTVMSEEVEHCTTVDLKTTAYHETPETPEETAPLPVGPEEQSSGQKDEEADTTKESITGWPEVPHFQKTEEEYKETSQHTSVDSEQLEQVSCQKNKRPQQAQTRKALATEKRLSNAADPKECDVQQEKLSAETTGQSVSTERAKHILCKRSEGSESVIPRLDVARRERGTKINISKQSMPPGSDKVEVHDSENHSRSAKQQVHSPNQQHQKVASGNKTRKNRRVHTTNRMPANDSVNPMPGPSGRCGCRCNSCRGCTGHSQCSPADLVQPKEQPIKVSMSSVPLEVSRDKEESPSALNHSESLQSGATDDGEPERIGLVKELKSSDRSDGSKGTLTFGPPDATGHFIEISFGDCEPMRIFREIPPFLPAVLQFRPFYHPEDRVLTTGMDVSLGIGCMDRLIASGFNMDDFIINEVLNGCETRTLFMWPGPPTKPCIDLVRQGSLPPRFCAPSLPATYPDLTLTELNEQKSALKSSKGTLPSERGSSNGEKVGDTAESTQDKTAPNSDRHLGEVASNGRGQSQSEEQQRQVSSATVFPPLRTSSPTDTTDVEPSSPRSPENRLKRRDKPKKRIRTNLNRVWRKARESSTDPSSPYSTFESGSFSSDEEKRQEKAKCHQMSPMIPPSTSVIGQSTTVNKDPITDASANAPIAGGPGSVRGHSSAQRLATDSGGRSADVSRRKTRHHLREVRRARRAAKLLRRVRWNSLHAVKAIGARKLVRQTGTRRPPWMGRSLQRRHARDGSMAIRELGHVERICAKQMATEDMPAKCVQPGDYTECAEIPRGRDPVSNASVQQFHQQLAFALGSSRQPTLLNQIRKNTDSRPMARTEIAASNNNVFKIYSTVSRVAESTSVEEVEVELRPKDSPALAGKTRHILQKDANTGEHAAAVKVEPLDSNSEHCVQRENAPTENTATTPLSPHSKADGLWNGRGRRDSAGTEYSSIDLVIQDAVEEADGVDVSEVIHQIGRANSVNMAAARHRSPDVLSQDIDFVRDFEQSELGKLITLGEELEETPPCPDLTEMSYMETESTCVRAAATTLPCDVVSPISVMVSHESSPTQSPLLEAMAWNPTWLQPPPMSPCSRLWSEASRRSGSSGSPEFRHASPSELLLVCSPAAVEDQQTRTGGAPPLGFALQRVPRAIRGMRKDQQRLGVNPDRLMLSSLFEPEDNLFAHGDPARSWMSQTSPTEMRLADSAFGRYH